MALLFTLVMCILMVATRAAGSGRAFPIGAENYIIEKFKTINPYIAWDATNYLVDKAGFFANCDQIGRGYKITKELTPDRSSIGVIYDNINGHGVDVESVNTYIEQIVDDWIKSRLYEGTIAEADTFGCSVRPGCSGVVAVACLFSQERLNNPTEPEGSGYIPPCRDTRPPSTYTPRPPTSTTRLPPTIWRTTKGLPPPTTRPPSTYTPTTPTSTTRLLPTIWPTTTRIFVPRGLAFTQQQYDVARKITGRDWDRSHFLENLSGLEITCNMLGASPWYFTSSTTQLAKDYGIDVLGLEGSAQNLGSTQDAMEEILNSFNWIPSATQVGCSVIPDCISRDRRGEMWVIVACIYKKF